MRVLLCALLLTLACPPAIALAESPPPSAPPSPSPPASPAPAPSGTAKASPIASATAQPAPSPSVHPDVTTKSGVPIEEMRRVIAAASLLERIEAQRRLADAEKKFLTRQIDELRARHEATIIEAAEARSRADAQRLVLERLVERAYRASRTSPLEVLLRRGSVVDVVIHLDGLATLSAQEREVLGELRAVEARLAATLADLERQRTEMASLSETVAAKDATLAILASRAERLAAAARLGPRAVSEAEVDILRALAEQAAREHDATTKLIAEIAARSGVSLPRPDRWEWPLVGFVTQEFGPSALELEPPRTYRGIAYPNFHDGIDIAAPLGSPVRSAAKGRVAFVGHIAGGAMVVIVVHDGGLVSLYGHLDDTTLPPSVRAGDAVEAGERIGAVGLTGITTGAHLHFIVSRGDEPIDPRALLPEAK